MDSPLKIIVDRCVAHNLKVAFFQTRQLCEMKIVAVEYMYTKNPIFLCLYYTLHSPDVLHTNIFYATI